MFYIFYLMLWFNGIYNHIFIPNNFVLIIRKMPQGPIKVHLILDAQITKIIGE